jgi:hypothetical protein
MKINKQDVDPNSPEAISLMSKIPSDGNTTIGSGMTMLEMSTPTDFSGPYTLLP